MAHFSLLCFEDFFLWCSVVFTWIILRNIFYLFIWLHWVLVAALGIFDLHSRTWSFCCCCLSSMRTLSCGMRDLVPWPGIEPSSLHWECGVLVTGPPREIPWIYFLKWILFKKHLAFYEVLDSFRASLVGQLVKNLPAMWKTWVRPLGWEDPLE